MPERGVLSVTVPGTVEAWGRLLERFGTFGLGAVLEPAAMQKDNPFLRARALWQLGYMGDLRYFAKAFDDANPDFRVLAMRIMHDAKGQSPIDYTPEGKARLLKDPSSAVRREAQTTIAGFARDQAEYRDARMKLLDTDLEYTRVRVDLAKTQAELLYLTGE